jgi:peptidoglycan/LPS O-acetylase OafA/YrhL
MSLTHPTYRSDIDGLRAIAVLSVVAFHAFPKAMTGGFTGVDVFFVISGFLISTILYGSLERNQFSLIDFYGRRIRRIFPALILVLASCFAAGWFVLLPDEYAQLGKHMAGGAGFVQNFVLWGESGYFDNLAETKPLLHLWSLGIEEQFYIFWPLILWAGYRLRFNLLAITLLLAITSFVLNIRGINVTKDLIATFYAPQTRFWELLIGATLAYLSLHSQVIMNKWSVLSATKVSSHAWANIRSTLGVLLLVLGFVLTNKKSAFPGWWALLPAIGSVLILSAGAQAWINKTVLSNRVLVWFGLISYPLYLWHWALLSFARILEGGVPSEWVRAVLVVASIALSAATYYLVEKPIRFGKHLKAKTVTLILLMGVVGFVGYNAYQREGLGFREIGRLNVLNEESIRFNHADQLDQRCAEQYHSAWWCKLDSSDSPSIALIGDSFANAYYEGLNEQYKLIGKSLLGLGVVRCPPLTGLETVSPGHSKWKCNHVYEPIFEKISKNKEISTVILAANWHWYILGDRFHPDSQKIELLSVSGELKSQAVLFEEEFRKTINLLLTSRKELIILKQTPELNISPRNCIIFRGLNFLKDNKCLIKKSSVDNYLAQYEIIFDKILLDYPQVEVWDPKSIFCNKNNCQLKYQNISLYRDEVHLSNFGSRYLAQHLNLK